MSARARRFDVCVVGGGASGLVCAIAAAERGKRTVVCEASDRVGKKLLSTGNGRCNLAPAAFDPTAYNTPFVEAVLSRVGGLEGVLGWFSAHGLLTATEQGRVYPASFHAGTVLDVLRAACARAGVWIETGQAVDSVAEDPAGKRVLPHGICADTLVLATGSPASGGRGDESLAVALGLPVRPFRPALTPLATDPARIKGLRGVRIKAALTLTDGARTVATSAGELLFKDAAVSGIAVFDLSSAIARERGAEYRLTVDCFPQTSESDLDALIRRFGTVGLCHKALAAAAEAQAENGGLAFALKHFRLPVRPARDFSQAQVACGGVSPEALDATCRARDGLYVIGEAVDADGICGGYNLLWAWASGLAAGQSL